MLNEHLRRAYFQDKIFKLLNASRGALIFCPQMALEHAGRLETTRPGKWQLVDHGKIKKGSHFWKTRILLIVGYK